MTNLENKEILPIDIFNTMKIIAKQCPNVIFGGSIALNAVGLLNRPVGDIDTFFGEWESLERNGFLTTKTICFSFSDRLSDDDGHSIQRTGVIINGVHVCVFKVDQDNLQYSLINIHGETFKIQNVNCAIQAKIQYSNRGVEKHKQDLKEITLKLNVIGSPLKTKQNSSWHRPTNNIDFRNFKFDNDSESDDDLPY